MLTKIVFFGTSEFAVPALTKLAADSNYQIMAVVTQPDKPAGRKQQPLPSPVKLEAEKLGFEILQPQKLDSKFHIPNSDLAIVASYGKIIPNSILELPRLGVLNIHPSLLPKYRGPSPIHAAILNGDAETGVTIMQLDEEMDHGDVVASSKFKIQSSKVKYRELHDQLASVGAELLIKILPKYVSGEMKPVPQEHSKATFTNIIEKDDARIDWKKSALEIDRMIRAYHEWPVAWTTLDGKRLKIYNSEPETNFSNVRPGQIIETNAEIKVRCGEGALKITELQEEGGKKLPAKDFINGHPGLKEKILV